MVKESNARLAAAVAAAAAPTASVQRKSLAEEDNIISEVPLEVMSITLCFASLPQKEIIWIFHIKFKLINLYQLYHMRGLHFDAMQDHDRVGIEDEMLKLRKISGTYKDFGKFFYKAWANAFHNYTTILVFFFGKKAPDLYTALADFNSSLYKLSTVYNWQETGLPMAIEVHTLIVAQQPTDPLKWVIPEKFQGRFCLLRTLKGMRSIRGREAHNKRKRSRSPIISSCRVKNGSNNSSVTCKAFNKGGCG